MVLLKVGRALVVVFLLYLPFYPGRKKKKVERKKALLLGPIVLEWISDNAQKVCGEISGKISIV